METEIQGEREPKRDREILYTKENQLKLNTELGIGQTQTHEIIHSKLTNDLKPHSRKH